MLANHSSQTRRRGVTTVEMAVVISAFLLFLFAIFEYGRFVMIRQLLENAAREGAREAIVTTNTGDTAAIKATVTKFLVSQPVQNLDIQVFKAEPATGKNIGAWTAAAFGEAIAVQITGDYAPILPTFGFLKNPTGLRAVVMMRSEAN